MKQYPRIYSLTTVGLIHHQEFDYLFHPFRTDFIGESGSGKSMIADLIQLIFVGSDAFESATKATSKREPDGMVLTQGGNIKVTGYAFLNIEMKPRKYIAVGCCIETGNKNTQALIIQKGYSWDAIEYLDLPLSNIGFLQENEILPIDRLKETMTAKGLFCQSWVRIKKFHEILYAQKILPIDLAASEKQLKDYAEILQSFSRGKMLDIQKSSSVKDFLFGNHSAKEIYEKYKNAVRDMEAAVGEYGANLKEIGRVTQKQKSLIELKNAKGESDAAEKKWAEKRLLYASQQVNFLETEITNLITGYASAKQHVGILRKLLAEEILLVENELPVLERQRGNANAGYESVLPKYSQIKKVELWLKEADCTPEQLQLKFKENKISSEQKELLGEFVALLKEKKVIKEFEKIAAKESFTALNNHITESLAKAKLDIEHKESLKRFSNVNNPESLAFWAIEQNRAFSLEEESVILGFQKLARKKPDNNGDYLPLPAELFQALIVEEKEQDGFWINLAGIRRYVKYATGSVFKSGDKDIIKAFFLAYSNNIDEEIAVLKNKFDMQTILQEIILSLKSPSDSLAAYNNREYLSAFKIIPALNVTTELFNECIETYNDADNVKALYDKTKKEYDEFGERFSKAKNLLESYRNLDFRVAEDIDNNTLILLQRKEYAALVSDVENRLGAVNENIRAELSRSTRKLDFFAQEKPALEQKILLIRQLLEKESTFQKGIMEFDNAKSSYLKLFGALPETLIADNYVTEPGPEKEIMIRAQQVYIEQYKTIIQQYISREAYRLEGEKDFAELAKNLLPEAFHQVLMLDKTEEGIIESIATYLNRINEKNRQLNNRKIQKIKDLLYEVDAAASAEENTVRRIDNFLKNETNITGGYKARLKKYAAVLYPRDWINNFIEKLEDNYGSFSTALSDKVDIENMMKTAFVSCGGSQNTDVSVNKLLDPTSYYELEFKMESETGRINKGSTGQTYAAIALLCIARLSVMSNEEGKKAQPAVRIMPIDEAEGLGSNYDMLHDIARNYDYQLISLSINPVGKFNDGGQYIYMLHKNMEVEEPVNYTPMAILSDGDKILDSSDII